MKNLTDSLRFLCFLKIQVAKSKKKAIICFKTKKNSIFSWKKFFLKLFQEKWQKLDCFYEKNFFFFRNVCKFFNRFLQFWWLPVVFFLQIWQIKFPEIRLYNYFSKPGQSTIITKFRGDRVEFFLEPNSIRSGTSRPMSHYVDK